MNIIYHYLSAEDHPDGEEGFITHGVKDIDACPLCRKAKLNIAYLLMVKKLKSIISSFRWHVFKMRLTE